jgi:hypothetical protein
MMVSDIFRRTIKLGLVHMTLLLKAVQLIDNYLEKDAGKDIGSGRQSKS